MSSGDLPGSSVAILLHLRRASNAQLHSRRCQAQMAFLHTPRPAFGAQAHLSLSLKCCANASSKVLLSSALSMRALAVSACMALEKHISQMRTGSCSVRGRQTAPA